jgi:hypothetical protein
LAVLRSLVGRQRREFGKNVELLVLRHQLVVLGQQHTRVGAKISVLLQIADFSGCAPLFGTPQAGGTVE